MNNVIDFTQALQKRKSKIPSIDRRYITDGHNHWFAVYSVTLNGTQRYVWYRWSPVT
jgi:hypothetical protein